MFRAAEEYVYDLYTIYSNKVKHVPDEKQITYILTQNDIAIPVHFKFFRV